MSRKKIEKIVPFSMDEATFIGRLSSMLEYRKELLVNNHGCVTMIKLKSLNSFKSDDISFLREKFKAKYNKVLIFEEVRGCGFHTASLTMV